VKEASNVYKSQKLIRIFLKYDENSNTIQSICITGDFFIHPEETVEKLEAGLIGTKLDEQSIIRVINTYMEGSEVFGFDLQSITKAILGCLSNHE
jgi:hypothetical protein